MVTVKLDVENIVSVQEIPMESRADETYNDLYLIEIRNVPDTGKPYAVGLFDLSKDITVSLPEGGEFWFQGFAVKDGKAKVYSIPDGLYASFGYTPLTNSFTQDYYEDYFFRPDLFVLKSNKSEKEYEELAIAKDLEVYILTSQYNHSGKPYKVSDDNTETISFRSDYRIQYIGTEFTAEDMQEGKLYVSFSAQGDAVQPYYSPEIEVASENQPVFNTFSFNYHYTRYIMGDGLEITLHMKWVKNDGTEVVLDNTNAKITVKNGYKYAVTINVGSTSTPQMEISKIVTPTFDSDHTEKWHINKGQATKQ